MTAPYNPSVPQSTDRPSISQGQLLANFSELNTIFAINHVTFNATTNAGKHTYVAMIAQAAPATAAGEGAAYTFNTGGTREQFRYRRESSGVNVPITEWIGAFCHFQGTNPAVIDKQFNIASVTRISTTSFDVVFTNALTDTFYIVAGMPEGAVAGQSSAFGIDNKTVNGFRLRLGSTGGVPWNVGFAVFGEIA